VWKTDESDIYSINIANEKWIIATLDKIDFKKTETELFNGKFNVTYTEKIAIERYEYKKSSKDEIELDNFENLE